MMLFSNLILVLKDWKYALLFIIFSSLLYFIMDYFTYKDLIIGNYGEMYYIFQLLTQGLIAILLGFFTTLTLFKIFYFSSFSLKETSTTGFASFFGVIMAGCPACSITLATYLGLTGFIALFPYDGLEIKLAVVPILIYANYVVLKKLTSCDISKRQKMFK